MLYTLLVLACAKDPETAEYTPQPKPQGGEVVTLTTRDSVDIVADYYAASSVDRPLAVFVHMDPRGANTRNDWPGEVLQPLVDADWAVMVPDRRGAGDSGGVAEDAFQTVAGAYDIEAVVLRAEQDGFGSFVLIGASNGTTSVLDYSALSVEGGAASEAWPAPDAFIMLSAVGPTTNNHEISQMPTMPGWFGFPASEADDNQAWQDANPGDWSFTEYDPGAHGTRMFGDAPDAAGELSAWVITQE
ncbi:MAG: pimeloyl-ACP methyl ester carboxylesterase [Cognaticolwellia sp.]|jgi:pimeloyl-ACP methyl ester carboxylesterase